MARKFRALAAIVGFIGLGYLSSWCSTTACERRLTDRLATHRPPRRAFVIPESRAASQAWGAWTASGADYSVYDPRKHGPELIPWCSVEKGQIWIPFLVRVNYDWVGDAQVGGGGDLWFFCFFGLTAEIGHWVMRAR